MDFILFVSMLGFSVNGDLYVYNSFVPENIEYCANIIHDPSMEKEYKEECDNEQTMQYILNVKEG